MSSDYQKSKRNKRIEKEETAIQRQVRIAKEYGVNVDNPHKFAKHHALNCGDPNCAMCGNPRKFFKEKTIQEKKFEQKEKYYDSAEQSSRSFED